MSEKFSVLIPDGESPYAISVLRCLAQMKNVKTYILSNNRHSSIRYSRYTNNFLFYKNNTGNEGRLAAIVNAVKKTNVDVVLPVDFETICLLSVNRELLSGITSVVSLPEIKAINISADKWLLGQWLKEKQIPAPATILYQKSKEFERDLSALSFPVLIKPRRGSGGRGIEFFNTPDELHSFCNRHVDSEEFIVQSFIKGYDIDCSVLCHEGKIQAYTIQKGIMYAAKHVSWPSGIDFLYDSNTYEVVKEMMAKFNWSGIVHIDLRYDENEKKIKIIEMNPRFWASVSASTFAGVNFPYLACLAGLHLDFNEITIQPKRVVRSSAALRLFAKRIIHGKCPESHFDNSFGEFLLKDPLPNLFGSYTKMVNMVFNKKEKRYN